MKLSVQTLANKKFPVDVEESDTVLTLKQKIQDELKLADVEEQKLIHLGKILKNEQTIESAGIKANAIIVLMISKIKKTPAPAAADSSAASPAAVAAAPAAAAPAAAAAAPAAAATPVAAAPAAAAAPAVAAAGAAPVAAAGAAPVAAAAPAAGASPNAAAPAAGASPVAANAASALAMGAGLEVMITDLMALGFPRDQVQLALRASFNNPDRAADYLFNGIPDSVLQQQQAQQRAPAPQQAAPQQQAPPAAGGAAPVGNNAQANALAQLMAQGNQGGGGGGDVDPNNPLAGLAASPQFQQMRAMLQAQPQLIPMLLQQLAQSNPDLAQLIAENPDALADILAGGGGGGGGGAPQGQQGGQRSQVIQITMEEKAQLDRLEALGFSRQRALEAWVLCDRNEDLAANYLFDNAGQDDDMGQGQ